MSKPFIETFLSEVRKKGFVKSNRFVALIQPNYYVTSQYFGYPGFATAITERLAVTCFSATIPSFSLMTNEFGISYPNRLIPYAKSTNNQSGASFEFYCLGDMFEKELFHNWINGIVDPYTKESDYYGYYASGSMIHLIMVPNIVKTHDEVLDFVSNQTASENKGKRMTGFTFTEVYPYMYTYNGGSVNYQANTSPATDKVDFMFRDIVRFGSSPPRQIEISDVNPAKFGKVEFPPVNVRKTPFQQDIKEYTLKEARREFDEAKRREQSIEYENAVVAEMYNQKRNVPRGVDGKLLNPETDGLPEQNPNDRIRSALFGALSFVQQGKGFGIF